MGRYKKISLRSRHFVSYMGLAVCACTLIGFLVLNHSISVFHSSVLEDYRVKMALAAEDLQTQQAILENISYKVRTTPCYRPFFTQRNAYYEVEAVEDIAKYQDYSPIVSDYYCIIRDTDSAYSQRGKMSIDQFFHYKLTTDNMLAQWLDRSSFFVIEHPAQPQTLLMVIPMRIVTDAQSPGPDACLVFYVTRADLLQRLEKISGLDAGEITATWHDILLIGSEAGEDELISVSDSKGNYTLTSSARVEAIYQKLMNFKQYSFLLLVSGMVILVLVALYMAKRSYKPIDQLISKLNIPQNGNWQDVEAVVKGLQESQLYTKEQLQDDLRKVAQQQRQIACQILFAKLSGVRDDKLDDLLVEAGIALNLPLFSVLLIQSIGSKLTETRLSAIARSLSDDNLSLHSAGQYQEQSFILLANFTDREQLWDLCSILSESLELEGESITIRAGDIYEGMDQLYLSFVSALTGGQGQSDALAKQAPSGGSWYDDRQARLMMQALKEGDAQKVQTCLTEMIDMLKTSYPSMLIQRCVWADVGNLLLKTTREMNDPLEPKRLHALLLAQDIDGFHQQLSAITREIVSTSMQRSEQVGNDMQQQVVEYIKGNLFSPQFTIDQVAAHFDLSDRKVGNIVREVTGMTYKEFIIQLRVEYAKVLLTSNKLTVAQTGESVGYNNIPYFIKTFRTYTGYTPGEYKKLFDRQENTP